MSTSCTAASFVLGMLNALHFGVMQASSSRVISGNADVRPTRFQATPWDGCMKGFMFINGYGNGQWLVSGLVSFSF